MAETRCKRCLLREAFPEDYRRYVEGLLRAIPPRDRLGNGAYEARLRVCARCVHLDRGTCMGCGCLVELRAAYRREKCPFQKWDKTTAP